MHTEWQLEKMRVMVVLRAVENPENFSKPQEFAEKQHHCC